MKPSPKQKRLLALGLVLVAFVTLALLNTVDFSKTPEISTNAPYAPDTFPLESFYPTPTEDLSSERAYQKLDRTPSYTTKDGLTEDLDTAYDPPYTEFFKSYFAALQKGDAKALNALHSEVYFRNHAEYESFSRQYLYDVSVKYFDKDVIDKADSAADEKYIGWQLTYFEVTYRIYKNDGSFRRDILNDMAITQIFTLLSDKTNGNPKLNSISYWTSDEPTTEPATLLPLILPLVWLGLTLISLTVLLILKKRVLLALPLAAFLTFLVSTAGSPLVQLVAFLLLSPALFLLFTYLAKRKAAHDTESSDIESSDAE